jgi:hypothetical protein
MKKMPYRDRSSVPYVCLAASRGIAPRQWFDDLTPRGGACSRNAGCALKLSNHGNYRESQPCGRAATLAILTLFPIIVKPSSYRDK